MLEFMDSMNEKFKHDKVKKVWQKKMIELLMMQSARPFFLIKKLAKVNMLSTFSGFGKARKVKKHLLEMDNHYNV